MRTRPLLASLAVATAAACTNAAPAIPATTATPSATALMTWPIHALDRPQPAVVRPGASSPTPIPAPSDAIVLFDGTGLGEWEMEKGGDARWTVRDGAFEVVAGTGTMRTRRAFGDVQLHIEWASPSPPRGTGQDRGNSGVFFMGRYEVQVLDSHGSTTYPDGQASAIYGQYPPLVNATRPPGEWQAYDIVFRAPRFADDGALRSPARLTVLHNGVLVHDAVELTGPTGHHQRPPYAAHAARLPLSLQDHDHPVRFRNVWVRELGDAAR